VNAENAELAVPRLSVSADIGGLGYPRSSGWYWMRSLWQWLGECTGLMP